MMAVRTSISWGMVSVGVVLILASISVDAQLRQNFYARTCPQAESIVASVIQSRVRRDRTQAGSLLRLHFHDCFVIGCEASVLLDSTPGNLAEKDAGPNANSLRGFDSIDIAKAAVESICPSVVSCADILALAARDAIVAIGGPSWNVPTGRRDGTISIASQANSALPGINFSFSQLKKNFARVGLNEKDLTVLAAAHTIGFSRCSNIIPRLYNFPNTNDGIDPTLDKTYAKQLQKSCPPSAPNNIIPLDPTNGGQTFDTGFYNNIVNNRGLFKSDESLLSTTYSRNQVIAERNSPSTFFSDFGRSMEKMNLIGALTSIGEIRQNCHRINPPSSTPSAPPPNQSG